MTHQSRQFSDKLTACSPKLRSFRDNFTMPLDTKAF